MAEAGQNSLQTKLVGKNAKDLVRNLIFFIL